MPRFSVGDRVTILDLGKPGHVRIPFFVRQKTGTVERYCGAYPNPEELAFGGDGLPEVDLYRVHFALDNLWPLYSGERIDSLEIEVYDHWLAPAEEGVR